MNPLKRLFRYSDTVSFEVTGDVGQAVESLSRSASKPILQATWGKSRDPSLVGNVSKESVRLHKVTPMFGNFFKPIFFGRFQTQDHKVSLIGRFEMGSAAQLAVWFSVIMGLATQIVALPQIGTESGLGNLSFLGPTLFIVFGILVVLSGKISGKQDIVWIKHQIESALTN